MKVESKKNLNVIDYIQKAIQPVLCKYPIKRASLFGSYARQDAHSGSDIDILVEFSDTVSLLQFVGIQQELEDILKKKVDLVDFSTLKSQLKVNILEEQIAIYG